MLLVSSVLCVATEEEFEEGKRFVVSCLTSETNGRTVESQGKEGVQAEAAEKVEVEEADAVEVEARALAGEAA